MAVVIDGVEYAPVSMATEAPRIGVGITTHNRWDTLWHTLGEIQRLTPGAKIVVVDDASTTQPEVWDGDIGYYHFEENVGIARAKNKCLEMLEDCEEIFLFDDDAYPLVENWWEPYVNSPEPHLMRIFADLAGEKKLRDIREVYRDHKHVAYTGPRGMMLYLNRLVLTTVGGMDVAYGKWGYEHGDWSNRIHNAGLTTWRFADVINGGDLIYSMDEHEEIERSVEKRQRRQLVQENVIRYRENWDSAAYMPYTEKHNVVMTCLFTGHADPQRPLARKLDTAALKGLVDSLGGLRLMLFTDVDTETSMKGGVHEVYAPLGVRNLYIQRWISYWDFLRENTDIDFVWCVDGTDVEMLRHPFPLERGKLYLGDEPTIVGNEWVVRNRSALIKKLVAEHGDKKLYNAGLVGGEREVVLDFIHSMIKLYFDNQIAMFLSNELDVTEVVNDMGILNIVAHSGNYNVISGPAVNTTFKSNSKNAWSMWKHK